MILEKINSYTLYAYLLLGLLILIFLIKLLLNSKKLNKEIIKAQDKSDEILAQANEVIESYTAIGNSISSFAKIMMIISLLRMNDKQEKKVKDKKSLLKAVIKTAYSL